MMPEFFSQQPKTHSIEVLRLVETTGRQTKTLKTQALSWNTPGAAKPNHAVCEGANCPSRVDSGTK